MYHAAPTEAREAIGREGLKAHDPGRFKFSEGEVEEGTPRVYFFEEVSLIEEGYGIEGCDVWACDVTGLDLHVDYRSSDGSWFHEGDIEPGRLALESSDHS